jgi:membrane protein implicated in regulation of membrane protease activity
MPVHGLGKLLMLVGGIVVLIGALLLLSEKIPWLGRLPGDIYIQRPHFTFFFPLTTSILISIILTLVLYFLSRR